MMIRLVESNIENGLSNLSKQKITIRLFEQQAVLRGIIKLQNISQEHNK